MVYLNQWTVFALHNPYTIEVDKENQNYYNCEGFRYLARNCRNRGTGDRIKEDKRLEYRNNRQNEQNNLNRDRDLIVLN